MSKTRFILVALICASPAILLWDGLITQGLLAGIVAIALAITARTLRPGETEFLVPLVRPVAAAAVVPALWILFQVLPLRALAHPIWTSAEAALGHAVTGTISIDPGASVIGLGQFLALGAVAFLSAAVAVDRQRAEWLLFALTAAAAAIGLIVMTDDLRFAGLGLSPLARAQAVDCVALGAIIASAACVRTVERYETRHASPLRSAPVLLRTLTLSGIALAICAVALVVDGTRQVLVATACGLAAFACVVIIRRFGLGAWGAAAIAVPVIGVAALLVIAQPAERGKSALLAFAASSPVSTTAVSERVLDDAPLVGTGAGTFAAIAPVYREMDDPPSGPVASTAAATFAIELGRPLLWLIVAATAGAILVLLRASLRRGRDSFYPAMGASCLITLFLFAFINAGLLGSATGVIVAAALGLAIAQSKSRTLQT